MSFSPKLIFFIILTLSFVFVVGFLIGFFTSPKKSSDDETAAADRQKTRFEAHEKLYKSLKADNLRSYLRRFTDRPHIAGSEIQLEYGKRIEDEWRSYKTFDKVEVFPYNVLLSYMEQGDTNVVDLLDDTGGVMKTFQGKEKILEPGENDTAVIPPILGYAKPGNATGKLIYANYGRKEDFKKLTDNFNTNCSGYIVIMRYGKIYRGDKINLAAKCGAVGAILYNDPQESAPLGQNNTYPKTWWLPPSGVQRGNLRLVKGDPLTPEVPAIDGIYRSKVEDVYMPPIPATPLPYGQATELLKLIKGTEAPADWQGGLNFKYHIGINGSSPNVTIHVNAKLRRRNITNIVGTIVGKEEPDRWVLVGSHRDGWAFGAVDSSSGTAVMMEIARGLKTLVESGWRPRRTIKFCSWGAEEQGLIGSIEWVEQQSKIVRERAVAYINIDAVVRGNHSLRAKGSPLLKQLLYDESKKVDDPRDESQQGPGGSPLSLYQRWQASSSKGSGLPKYGSLGSGSDFVPFYQFLGVPSIAYDYTFSDLNATIYPVYHSVHDTFNWVEKFVDPNFIIHLSMTKLTARLLLRLADSNVLPMDVTKYSDSLVNSLKNLNTSRLVYSPEPITIDHIERAIHDFNKTSYKFENRRRAFSSTDFSTLRILNNQMASLEQIFINPYGLPGRPDIRNIVFAPAIVNLYGSSSFPGITDQLSEKTVDWREVMKQINILYKSLREADEFLQPLDEEGAKS